MSAETPLELDAEEEATRVRGLQGREHKLAESAKGTKKITGFFKKP